MKTSVPFVSIVTATFNKIELTQAFWQSLLAYPPSVPWEIIWVDDGSTDDTRNWLFTLSSSPNFKIIFNEVNLGYANANNRGVSIADGEILCFLNNDILLTPGWFEPLLSIIQHSKYVGVVGNVQISPASGTIDHAGIRFNLVGMPYHRFKGLQLAKLKSKCAQYKAVTAACWLIYKNIYLEFDGFSSLYRNGFEDIDFCLRLDNAGFKHWVSYDSIIYHHVGSSPGRRDHDKHNMAVFLKKWSAQTAILGRQDWPRFYIAKCLRNPRQTNFIKLMDACFRFFKIKHGDSFWALQERESIISFLDDDINLQLANGS